MNYGMLAARCAAPHTLRYAPGDPQSTPATRPSWSDKPRDTSATKCDFWERAIRPAHAQLPMNFPHQSPTRETYPSIGDITGGKMLPGSAMREERGRMPQGMPGPGYMPQGMPRQCGNYPRPGPVPTQPDPRLPGTLPGALPASLPGLPAYRQLLRPPTSAAAAAAAAALFRGREMPGLGLRPPRGSGLKRYFRCPQCFYLTDRKNNLKRHIGTMHSECGKRLECCGIQFHSKASLRDHVLLLHRAGYRCHQCARNFCRKALLKRHLAVHAQQQGYDMCSLLPHSTPIRPLALHGIRGGDGGLGTGRYDDDGLLSPSLPTNSFTTDFSFNQQHKDMDSDDSEDIDVDDDMVHDDMNERDENDDDDMGEGDDSFEFFHQNDDVHSDVTPEEHREEDYGSKCDEPHNNDSEDETSLPLTSTPSKLSISSEPRSHKKRRYGSRIFSFKERILKTYSDEIQKETTSSFENTNTCSADKYLEFATSSNMIRCFTSADFDSSVECKRIFILPYKCGVCSRFFQRQLDLMTHSETCRPVNIPPPQKPITVCTSPEEGFPRKLEVTVLS